MTNASHMTIFLALYLQTEFERRGGDKTTKGGCSVSKKHYDDHCLRKNHLFNLIAGV